MFYQPRDIDEALRIRSEQGPRTTPLGGGTDLVVALNRDGNGAQSYLDLSHVSGYSDVSCDDGMGTFGGGVTFAHLGRLGLGALSQAAVTVGGPAIRNRATIAGNLGTASPAADGCVALLATDALVELTHASRGKRRVPIADYFTGFKQTALAADELITAVAVPNGWRTAFYKIGKRSAINISVVCAAVGFSPEGGARIALGSIAPTVLRATKAEAILEQGGCEDDAIDAAAQSTMSEVSPIDDHRATAAYRRAMCGVLVRRLLRRLRDAEEGGGRP